MNRRITLIEDDEVISGNYSDFLCSLGFSVESHRTKQSALTGLIANLPDLVLLDITLNGERDAGFAICLELRKRSATLPIIFLSSHDGDIDKVSGFRLGADDYITKDVTLDFLAIRIEALFRRLEAYAQLGEAPEPIARRATDHAEVIRFDRRTSTVFWKSQPLRLTLTQLWMLRDLFDSAGQARSYAQLMGAAKIVVEPNTVSAHVKAIRQAFLDIDPGFDRIRTERGRGYRWLIN